VRKFSCSWEGYPSQLQLNQKTKEIKELHLTGGKKVAGRKYAYVISEVNDQCGQRMLHEGRCRYFSNLVDKLK